MFVSLLLDQSYDKVKYNYMFTLISLKRRGIYQNKVDEMGYLELNR